MNEILQSSKARAILADRASLIAAEENKSFETAKTALLVFEVGTNQKYGIPYNVIEKIIVDQKITPIPGANPLFCGVIYQNAEVWPVVDSNILFNCKDTNTEINLILLHSKNHRYGLSVGAIIGQTPFDESLELTHFPTANSTSQSFISGIYQTDIALVEIATVFSVLNNL